MASDEKTARILVGILLWAFCAAVIYNLISDKLAQRQTTTDSSSGVYGG